MCVFFSACIADDVNVTELLEQNDNDLTHCIRSVDKTIPALGKYWSQMCTIRLKIECNLKYTNSQIALTTTNQTNKRTIFILKSNQHQTNIHCVVHITDAGIT